MLSQQPTNFRKIGQKTMSNPIQALTSTIPFSGFYDSIHDNAVDRAIESLFEDDNGDCNSNLIAHFYCSNCINYDKVRTAYAKDYVQAFAIAAGLQLIFDELDSPKEYNFQTDRIFVKIAPKSVIELFAKADKNALRDRIRKEYTSRFGFISHYSPDIYEWPKDVMKWDHNQVGTLIAASVNFDEEKYMEDISGSGKVDNWVYSALNEKGMRLSNIAVYLRARQGRKK